ncbi:hypothetical protein PR202_ga14969 [Eleusine coracana subsp. coracana]|uniref:Uncharacterized protein n=1 Tax=Eleusine coracana subsp. coracana TaxID=191504 RepID=A0AAV5CJ18_ELECO|nr:hypothetical protein PR202_ga14969 [Eleusine coracana subsp. coracana]
MAAAFRSGTRRDAFAAMEDAGSATRGRPASSAGRGGGGSARRSRSLSRFPPPSPGPEEAPTPSSRFVNKVRSAGGGVGFPEISLDDLADEFFRARVESEDDDDDVRVTRGRSGFPAPAERTGGGGGSGRRSSTARYARETESSRQRERSVSRPPAERRGGAGNVVNGGAAARRQRYASVDRHSSMDRHRWCESNNDMEVSHRYASRGIHNKNSSGNSLHKSFHKPSKINQALKRSTSQNDFFHSRDSSSSHSSLTDDESRSSHSFRSRNEKTVRATYALDKEPPVGDEKGIILYDVMRKEVRQAVDEIRTQLEKAVAKSEPSENIPISDAQPTQVITELRRSYTSKLEERSNDRTRMSRRLTEEAEQYFEDFLSNVEDTDFSSFDGERSDTSSSRKDVLLHAMTETPVALPKATSPAEADGVVLPWLQWETSTDLTSPCKTKALGESTACSSSNHTMSSRGSWSPGDHGSSAASKNKLLTRFDEVGIRRSSCPDYAPSSSFHIDDYLHLLGSEELLFEKWRQRERMDSGGLSLCCRSTIL